MLIPIQFLAALPQEILIKRNMKTILEIIENHLNAQKSNCTFTFLNDGENSQSIVRLEEIRNEALKIAGLLSKQSSVLLLLPQGISFIKSFFGCLYAQAIAVPAAMPGKNRGIEKLKSIVADARIKVGITNQNALKNLQKWFGEDDLISSVRWILIEDVEQKNFDFLPVPELPKPEQIAFLQYTSGSTGNPKGVMVTHENIVANSKILQTFFQNNTESVSVCWLPSFHDMGLIDGIIQPIFADFQTVMMSPTHFLQKPVRWLKAITEFKATYSGAPNFAYDLCVERVKDEELIDLDLSSLRCLYNASEPIRHQTMRKFLDRFAPAGFSEDKLFTCYGLAEATLAVTASRLGIKPAVVKIDTDALQQNKVLLTENAPFIEIVSSGVTYCDTNLKIIEPDSFRECDENEIGEIWAAGKSITAGYLNSPEATRENFVDYKGARFLRTGDSGFLLKGELFVTGRIKDLIIIRGINHHPQDIKETVYSSHPALETNGCAAFSVEIDDEEKLVVVQELKRAARHNADYAAIFYEIVGEISKKHGVAPHDVVLVAPNKLPKTSSGKIRRSDCRKLWKEQKLNPLAVLREHLFYEKIPQ